MHAGEARSFAIAPRDTAAVAADIEGAVHRGGWHSRSATTHLDAIYAPQEAAHELCHAHLFERGSRAAIVKGRFDFVGNFRRAFDDGGSIATLPKQGHALRELISTGLMLMNSLWKYPRPAVSQ